MAVLQQHVARRDILIEPAARQRGRVQQSKLGDIPNWGRNRAVKTNWLVYLNLCLLEQEMMGPLGCEVSRELAVKLIHNCVTHCSPVCDPRL